LSKRERKDDEKRRTNKGSEMNDDHLESADLTRGQQFERFEERCAKLDEFIAREFAGMNHHDVCEVLRSHIESGFPDKDERFAQEMHAAMEFFEECCTGDFNDWIEAAVKAWLNYHRKTELSNEELLDFIWDILARQRSGELKMNPGSGTIR
jgi:hypothetical protein